MKNLLVTLGFVLTHSVFGQCNWSGVVLNGPVFPNPNTGTNLSLACEGQMYKDTIFLRVPLDTTLQGVTLNIQTLEVLEVSGIPSNVTYSCESVSYPGQCKWNGGEQGCVKIASTSPMTIGLNLCTVKVKLSPTIPIPIFPNGIQGGYPGYRIVTQPALLCPAVTSINENSDIAVAGITPNPSANAGVLKIMAQHNSMSNLTIYDALGKLVSNKKIELNSGENIINLDFSSLANGLYYYTLNAEKLEYKSKFSIVK